MKQITLSISIFRRSLQLIISLIAIFYIGLYLWTVLNRIGYPFELEWMEGAMVDECRQILAGNAIYRTPGLNYVPFIYPPGYFVLSSLSMSLLGVGFLAPRLISFLASMGSIFLLFLIVRRGNRAYAGGIISAGLFAATYGVTGAWMDVARVDSFFLFWITLGIFTATGSPAKKGTSVITAIIFLAAFFTKQVALAPAAAVGIYYLIKDRQLFFLYAVTILIVLGAGTLLLDYYSHGWYKYYVFLLSSRHVIQLNQIRDFLLKDIIRLFPFAAGLSLYAWVIIIKDWCYTKNAPPSLLYLITSASLFVVSMVGRGNINSYVNTLLPLALALSLLSGWIWQQSGVREVNNCRGRYCSSGYYESHSQAAASSCGSVFWVQPVLGVFIILQFLLLLYFPSQYIPTTDDRLAGEKLIDFIKNSHGPIFLPFHGYLPEMAGKESSAHWTAILDLLLAMGEEEDDPARLWFDRFNRALEEGRYENIILDREDWFPELLRLQYKKRGIIFRDNRVFYPVTGYPWRPQYIYKKMGSNQNN